MLKTAANTQVIVIGTRVYTNLYGRGWGTVYEIHGEQSPASIRSFGGIMSVGGNAHFDIVFDCGSTSLHLPECILRGVQWRIYEEIFSAEDIAKALQNSACVVAKQKAAEQDAQTAYENEIQRLKNDPQYSALSQGNDTYSGKLAAVNIRVELKKTFPGVKFSVRSDSGSVRVKWTDGPTESQVKQITCKYKAGSFNGMEDIYEYSRNPWTAVFGAAKYIDTHRDYSLSLVQRAIDVFFVEHASNVEGLTKPDADAFMKGQLCRIEVPGRQDLQQEIRRILFIL